MMLFIKKLSVLGNIVLLLCMGKQKLWNSIRLEQQSIKQNKALCGAEPYAPDNHEAITGRRMKPPSSAFDLSALSTELSTYRQPHEGYWDVSSKAGIHAAETNMMTAEYLKDVKYKEFIFWMRPWIFRK